MGKKLSIPHVRISSFDRRTSQAPTPTSTMLFSIVSRISKPFSFRQPLSDGRLTDPVNLVLGKRKRGRPEADSFAIEIWFVDLGFACFRGWTVQPCGDGRVIVRSFYARISKSLVRIVEWRTHELFGMLIRWSFEVVSLFGGWFLGLRVIESRVTVWNNCLRILNWSATDWKMLKSAEPFFSFVLPRSKWGSIDWKWAREGI